MENHHQNSLDPSTNANPSATGNNQDRTSSNGASISTSSQNPVYGGISTGIITPQMFQNNNGIFSAQSLQQDTAPANALSPPPGVLNPFLEFVPSRGGTITPSIASSYNSNPSSSALPFNVSNNSVNTSSTDLKAVTATMQSTATSGVIVPGVGNSRSSSNGKKSNSKGEGGKTTKRQRRISSVAAAATSALAAAPGPTPTTTLGGVTIPSIHPQASTALQVQIAAAAAAAEAAPLKPKGGNSHLSSKSKSSDPNSDSQNKVDADVELSTEEKAKINRDRNREHARSTRLRKKAYVNKLKELVEGLHAERTEETKKSRVAIQHLSEVQAVRKTVMRTFLKYLSNYESDERNWRTLMEDDFWLKQPITPFRSFPRYEIENECRKTRGIDGMITESASMSVMVEGIGSRSTRWMNIKRQDFLLRQDNTPSTVMGQNSNVSSLSSSSGSSNGNGSGNEDDLNQHRKLGSSVRNNGKNSTQSMKPNLEGVNTKIIPNKVSSGSSGSEYRNETNNNSSNEYHVYNAPSLPDPKYSGESCAGSDSTNELQGAQTHNVCADSSSADEENKEPSTTKNRTKTKSDEIKKKASKSTNNTKSKRAADIENKGIVQKPQRSGLPPNIAKKGGIAHSILPRAVSTVTMPQCQKNQNDRLKSSPVTPLPPFLGLGKKAKSSQEKMSSSNQASNIGPTAKTVLSAKPKAAVTKPKTVNEILNGKIHSRIGPGSDAHSVSESPAVLSSPISTDISSSSSRVNYQIKAYFHVNEDDMLITDDVLMCPFVFRSQEAVLCGALAECIMPGMLRARFSVRNKLLNLEMVYDAMGFMQQLERASGREGTAQIIPNSLDMALVPIAEEPRVITLAKPPFLIVSVNEAWTKMTKYTQTDAEGKQLKMLHGKGTDINAGVRPGKPCHDFAHVASGRCACSVNRHYDKHGSEYIEYSCSYPLSNPDNEITHILHISKALPPPTTPSYDCHDSFNSQEEV